MTGRFVSVSLLIALACIAAMISGCRQACDPADSKAVCAAVQECFESHPAAACRAREKDAVNYERNFKKNIAPAYDGTAKALNY
jgi:hypothetical protein